MAMIFSWNDWNVEHIAEHAVTPDEAEFVVRHARRPFPRAIGDGKLHVWGKTDSGRYLQVVFVYPADEEIDPLTLAPADRMDFADGEDVIYVIHAMEMTHDQKRQYRRLIG